MRDPINEIFIKIFFTCDLLLGKTIANNGSSHAAILKLYHFSKISFFVAVNESACNR
jgi:hypothetical protein